MINNRTIYAFGSQSTGFFSHVVLRENGRVHGDLFENETDNEPAYSWRNAGKILKL